MSKEIGSTYWLTPNVLDNLSRISLKKPNILDINESYVSTCRSAIGLTLDVLHITSKKALIPAFTCESVLEPFLKRGYDIFPYPVGKDLKIHWNEFEKVIREVRPSVILIHSYFGFNSTEELRNYIPNLCSRGIFFIEDMTQSMFSDFEPLSANFHVGSIRKWMPIPDGAFVTLPFEETDEDVELVSAKLKAFVAKGNWIQNGKGSKSVFRKQFEIAENILNSRDKVYSMSSISKKLYAATSIKEMKDRRRINYFYLENHISKDLCLSNHLDVVFNEIVSGICPFHLPIFVKENRNELQQYLASNDIYATVIWKCPDEFVDKINDDAIYIYNHILCFHIDQRYDMDDMDRIVDILKRYYKRDN